MRVLVFISLVGSLLLASCGGSSSKGNANAQEVNPADTIYLGDLREKFEGDSIFFKIVAPDLMLMDYQYLWAVTESEAIEKGLTKEYYKRVKKEITDTNEAIKRGVMKGANVNVYRISKHFRKTNNESFRMKAFIHTNIKTGESLNVTASPFYCCDGWIL